LFSIGRKTFGIVVLMNGGTHSPLCSFIIGALQKTCAVALVCGDIFQYLGASLRKNV
jgi:hypothetical protein